MNGVCWNKMFALTFARVQNSVFWHENVEFELAYLKLQPRHLLKSSLHTRQQINKFYIGPIDKFKKGFFNSTKETRLPLGVCCRDLIPRDE